MALVVLDTTEATLISLRCTVLQQALVVLTTSPRIARYAKYIMTESITINTHVYNISERGPTSTTRIASVSGVKQVSVASHQTQKVQGKEVVRTLRKISIPSTLADGTVVNTEASVVCNQPILAPDSALDTALTELGSWFDQSTFVTEIKTLQV